MSTNSTPTPTPDKQYRTSARVLITTPECPRQNWTLRTAPSGKFRFVLMNIPRALMSGGLSATSSLWPSYVTDKSRILEIRGVSRAALQSFSSLGMLIRVWLLGRQERGCHFFETRHRFSSRRSSDRKRRLARVRAGTPHIV